MAANVVADDAKSGVDERRRLRVPQPEVAAVAVDEDDGRSFAGVFVEGDDAVGVGVRHRLALRFRNSSASTGSRGAGLNILVRIAEKHEERWLPIAWQFERCAHGIGAEERRAFQVAHDACFARRQKKVLERRTEALHEHVAFGAAAGTSGHRF